MVLGLEASISDQKTNELSLDNVQIVVESCNDDKIHASPVTWTLDFSSHAIVHQYCIFQSCPIHFQTICFQQPSLLLIVIFLLMCNIECSICITTCLKYIVLPCLITSRYFALLNVKLLLRLLLSEKSLYKGD